MVQVRGLEWPAEAWFCAQWPIFVLFLRFVFGLLSGWKIQTWPIIRFLTESVTCWFFICWYLIESALLLCVHIRYNLFAHSSCTSLVILIFIKSTVDCIAHFSSLHILLLILFYCFLLIFLSYSYLYLNICSCVMYHLLFYFFALSIERTRPDLHFTTDYTLYDCVCDK